MPNEIDIVDEHDQPTGQRTNIASALKDGLWHRGAQVVLCTKDGYVVVQKRAKTMRMHPGKLDISCGGFVDAGETPEQAAVRETKEELGITITESQLHFIGTYRKNHAWPRVGIHDRAIIYCYTVLLSSRKITVTAQAEELAWAKFIRLSRARRLIRLHRLKTLGRIEPLYQFYRMLLRGAKHTLKD